ncbi:MAG: pilus assembly protein [Chloroflexi bacterium]|nr:pilus assembly protein [Chloroflexota bacterium]
MNKTTSKRMERGQSLVEFAISGMLLVILFSGLVDLARVYFTYIALEDAAGEAALYLSINPTCIDAGDCGDPNNADWRARNAVGGDFDALIDWGSAVIDPELPTAAAVGGTVFVTINYDHTLITPVIRNIAGDQINLQVEARQTIVSE